eukprot:1986121-Prymnesium_polylepis.1
MRDVRWSVTAWIVRSESGASSICPAGGVRPDPGGTLSGPLSYDSNGCCQAAVRLLSGCCQGCQAVTIRYRCVSD